MMLAWFSSSEMTWSSRREDRGHGTRVRRESRLKHDAGFHILERGDAPLQFHVDGHGAGDRPHCARARAVLLRGCYRRFDELGMIREPEIVVRREIDHFAAVEHRYGFAGRLQFAETLIRPRLLPAFELLGKISERIGPAHRYITGPMRHGTNSL